MNAYCCQRSHSLQLWSGGGPISGQPVSGTDFITAVAEEVEALLPTRFVTQLQALACSVQTCARAVYDFYLRHNIFIQQVLLLGMTWTVFASKVIVELPKRISQLALSCLNYMGFISLGSQFAHLSKACADFARALAVGEIGDILFTFSRVAVAATNIFLTVALFAGSLMALANCPGFALICNYVCHPLSFLAWIVGNVNNSIEYCDKCAVLSQLQAIKLASASERQRKISLLVQEVLRIIAPQCNFTFQLERASPAEEREFACLAMRTVRQLEGSTLRLFEDGLVRLHQQGRVEIDEGQACQFLKKIKSRLKEQHIYTYASSGISLFASLAMSVSKLSPDSALDWGARSLVSLLYTIKMIWKKISLFRFSEGLSGAS